MRRAAIVLVSVLLQVMFTIGMIPFALVMTVLFYCRIFPLEILYVMGRLAEIESRIVEWRHDTREGQLGGVS